MFTSLLNSCQIHVIPYWGTSLNLSTLIPIEGHKILAQTRIGSCVHNIQAKVNILVTLNLQINISSIHFVIRFLKANQLLNDVT